MAYKDLIPLGNGLIIAGTFFFLGLLIGNWPYDIKTLFSADASADAFENSIRHYRTWAETPSFALYTIHAFLALGVAGSLIKLYKPSDDTKLFEYGTIGLYVLAICVYLTNLRTGALSALHGEWGEVDKYTGVNVIAASEIIIIFLLGGVITLQAGLYYGEWDYQRRIELFNKEEAERKSQEKVESKPKPPASTKVEPVKNVAKTPTADTTTTARAAKPVSSNPTPRKNVNTRSKKA